MTEAAPKTTDFKRYFCPKCSYDVSATPQGMPCPECGGVIPAPVEAPLFDVLDRAALSRVRSALTWIMTLGFTITSGYLILLVTATVIEGSQNELIWIWTAIVAHMLISAIVICPLWVLRSAIAQSPALPLNTWFAGAVACRIGVGAIVFLMLIGTRTWGGGMVVGIVLLALLPASEIAFVGVLLQGFQVFAEGIGNRIFERKIRHWSTCYLIIAGVAIVPCLGVILMVPAMVAGGLSIGYFASRLRRGLPIGI